MKKSLKIIIKTIICLPIFGFCLVGMVWCVVGSMIRKLGFIVNTGAVCIMELSVQTVDGVSCMVNRWMGV